VTVDEIKEDLEEAMNHHGLKWEAAAANPIPDNPDKADAFIRFPTILSAMWAKGVLDRHSKYQGCLMRYMLDPCARPLTEMKGVSPGIRF
jgi:hypothetical protein